VPVVVETVPQAVPRTLHVILRTLPGVRDLHADLHQNMAASLDAIDEIAARQAPGRPSAATARTSKSASDSQPRS
jgi:hypothetical protein